MAEKRVCDGSVVAWEPRLEDTHCDECGHVSGQIDLEEPPFHGPEEKRGDDWYCSRCGDLMVGMKHLSVILERIRPRIIAELERPSLFLRYYKGDQWPRS